jgi:hypothetical protein
VPVRTYIIWSGTRPDTQHAYSTSKLIEIRLTLWSMPVSSPFFQAKEVSSSNLQGSVHGSCELRIETNRLKGQNIIGLQTSYELHTVAG